METSKFDKVVKKKLQERTINPSSSAWERLSVQLDEAPKKNKRNKFFYISIAASILLLISIGFQILSSKEEIENPILEEVVIQPKDKDILKQRIDQFINEVPVKEVLVKGITKENTEIITNKIEINKAIKRKIIINSDKENLSANNEIDKVIAKVDNNKNEVLIETSNEIKLLRRDPNSTIKINADDLLYAVTHSPKEVKAYYAKYKIDRDDVLKSIKNELKNSDIKINPETILAEVERSIDDEDFQNNFMKNLKRKVSDIASAIASRND